MAPSFAALCTDFYVNQKLALKMDLPSSRETVLDMFDRVRRELPMMDRLKRYEEEIALESADGGAEYAWLSMQGTTIRSGWVNPDRLERGYRLHQLILRIAPYYLSISPLDVEYLELVFGFDLEAEANRNEIVFDALLADSPLAALIDGDRDTIIDAQPFVGVSLGDSGRLQAYLDVKTRTRPDELAADRFDKDPISVFLTVRRHGPFDSLDDFASAFGSLAGHVERLAEERVIPSVLVPIRQTLLSRPG